MFKRLRAMAAILNMPGSYADMILWDFGGAPADSVDGFTSQAMVAEFFGISPSVLDSLYARIFLCAARYKGFIRKHNGFPIYDPSAILLVALMLSDRWKINLQAYDVMFRVYQYMLGLD